MKRVICALLAVLLTLTAPLALADGWQDVVDALREICEGETAAGGLEVVAEMMREAEAPQMEDSGFTFAELSDGTYAVTGYTGRNAVITLPAEYRGKPVTGIADYAFLQISTLRAVTIPEGCTDIGLGAFYGCHELESVSIPASVTYMGDGLFDSCSSLTSISVAAGNPAFEVENGVLYNRGKTELIRFPSGKADTLFIIPDSVKTIAGGAFMNCFDLKGVSIPEGVTGIGEYAFWDSGLTSVTIPASVTSVDWSAFGACYDLSSIQVAGGNTAYESADGVLYTKGKTALLVYPAPKREAAFVIPDSVTTICAAAFANCKNLTSITIPDSVAWIENDAFSGCENLTGIIIPDGVQRIEIFTFNYCLSLTDVTLPASLTYIDVDAFNNCPNLTLHAPAGSYAQTWAAENNIPFSAL